MKEITFVLEEDLEGTDAHTCAPLRGRSSRLCSLEGPVVIKRPLQVPHVPVTEGDLNCVQLAEHLITANVSIPQNREINKVIGIKNMHRLKDSAPPHYGGKVLFLY